MDYNLFYNIYMFRIFSKRLFSANANQVKEDISKYMVLVYSKSYCPYCDKTKKTFEDLGVEAKVFELDLIPNGPKIEEAVKKLTQQFTFPNIFIAGTHIGGNSHLQEGLKTHKIQKLLTEAKIKFKID
jgi:glutaredoxin 3